MAKMQTQEVAIAKLLAIHGDKYDFSESVYIGATKKITAKCSKHGYFTMRYADLKDGAGCNACGIDRQKEKLIIPYDKFIELSHKAHGETYDYSLSANSYAGLKSKVDIVCHKHGKFKQNASDHTQGNGCPKCQVNGFNRGKDGHIYLLSNGEFCKVGVTNRDIRYRVKEINKTLPDGVQQFKLITHFKADGQYVYETEQDILQTFKEYAAGDVKFSGSTETFVGGCFGLLLSAVCAYRKLAPKLGTINKKTKRPPMKSIIEVRDYRREKVLKQTGVPVGVVMSQGSWVFQETRRNEEGVKYKKHLARFKEKEDAISFALHYHTTGELLDTRKNLLEYNNNGWVRGVQTHSSGGYQANGTFTRPDGEHVKIYLGFSTNVEDVENLRRKFNSDLESGVYGEYRKAKYD